MDDLGRAVLIMAAVLLGLVLLGIVVCLCVFPYARTLRIMANLVDSPQSFSLSSLIGMAGRGTSDPHSNSGVFSVLPSVLPGVIQATNNSGIMSRFHNVCFLFFLFFLSFFSFLAYTCFVLSVGRAFRITETQALFWGILCLR
jgi:hypothetical protein